MYEYFKYVNASIMLVLYSARKIFNRISNESTFILKFVPILIHGK